MNNDQAQAHLMAMVPPDDYADFAAVLVEGGSLADPDDLLDYIRKPYKWAPEYVAWANRGKPGPDDEAWDRFADALNRLLAS
jgi:hypothetical protein